MTLTFCHDVCVCVCDREKDDNLKSQIDMFH